MEEELEDQEEDMWIKILVPLHLLSNFEIINYLNYKARLNGFFFKETNEYRG